MGVSVAKIQKREAGKISNTSNCLNVGQAKSVTDTERENKAIVSILVDKNSTSWLAKKAVHFSLM